jgi:hypothetical protein
MRERRKEPSFVVCIGNDDCEDLEIRKLYQVLPDDAAAEDGLLRIADESGEDYLYPARLFLKLDLPQEVERALIPAA